MYEWLSPLNIGLIVLAVLALVLLAFRFRRYLLPRSLQRGLPVAFLLVSVVSVLAVIAAVVLQLRTTLIDQKGNDTLTQIELNRNRLAEQIDNQMVRLQDIAGDDALANWALNEQKFLDEMSLQTRQAYFLNMESQWQDAASFRQSVYFNQTSVTLQFAVGDSLPLFSQIIVTDLYGGLAGWSGEEPAEFYFADEAWWQQARNTTLEKPVFVGAPYFAPDEQTVLVDVVMPLQSSIAGELEGLQVQGVLRGRLRLSDFSLFTEGAFSGENVEFGLVDTNEGRWWFSSTNPEKVGTTISNEVVLDDIRQNPVNWDSDEIQGQEMIHSHARLASTPDQPYLDDLNLTLILQQPAANALETLDALIQTVIVGGLFALAIASLIGVLIAFQITRPVNALTETAVAMAGGQLDQTAPETDVVELHTLAQSFNQMTGQLRQTLQGLEQQVASRTERLEIVATLGERLSSILKLEDLLTEVVNQIQDRFGYYHAHIYLLDEQRQDLLVAAGTGVAGAEMKAEGHHISLHALTSLVARAARSGEIVRVDNVRQTPDWLPNPLLPDTYSEMAVPIMLEGKVVGVLDVQENQIAGLDEGDAALLRSLANHVAVAINNARLFEEVQTALAEARELQRRYIEQAWSKESVAQRSSGRVQFSLGESTTLNEFILAKAREQAMKQKEPAVIAIDEPEQPVEAENTVRAAAPSNSLDSGKYSVLVAPISLGESTIGNLQLHDVDPNRAWTENDLALISAVIDQVAQTAENLRLLNETQERASRERLIGQVSDKLRRAPDMQALMKIATSEIARVLNPRRAFIRFDTQTLSEGNGGSGSDDNGHENVRADTQPEAETGAAAVDESLSE